MSWWRQSFWPLRAFAEHWAQSPPKPGSGHFGTLTEKTEDLEDFLERELQPWPF